MSLLLEYEFICDMCIVRGEFQLVLPKLWKKTKQEKGERNDVTRRRRKKYCG